ncbi:hypothetical protein [Agrobacterium tumefaciens]|uniref:hypothetical protein n=1 Tax=Agrobacterium tumefaciens TaxID=358 RepID=UPI0015742211|nr:hypothetical protein [Agrobacterium tumefaciens]NSY95513.1 hypothetical protein [Agrobacterium tumefaciens]
MIKLMKTTALAMGIALVSFAAPIPAGAQDMELRIGPDGVRPEAPTSALQKRLPTTYGCFCPKKNTTST